MKRKLILFGVILAIVCNLQGLEIKVDRTGPMSSKYHVYYRIENESLGKGDRFVQNFYIRLKNGSEGEIKEEDGRRFFGSIPTGEGMLELVVKNPKTGKIEVIDEFVPRPMRKEYPYQLDLSEGSVIHKLNFILKIKTKMSPKGLGKGADIEFQLSVEKVSEMMS